MMALSTSSIVAMLRVSEARVPEEARQADGQRDRPEVGEPERGADQHAEDLTDRAAGQAVQGGAERDAVQFAARRRHRVVVVVWVSGGVHRGSPAGSADEVSAQLAAKCRDLGDGGADIGGPGLGDLLPQVREVGGIGDAAS